MRYSEIIESPETGTYVGVRFSNETMKSIADYQAKHGIPNSTPMQKLHTTILYSRRPIPFVPRHDLDIVINGDDTWFDIFADGDNHCLVCRFDSDYLQQRFAEGRALGATFDYDAYKPHITLSYDSGDFDYQALPQFDFDIVLDDEYVEPLDLDA